MGFMAQIPTTNGLWGDDESVLTELGQRLARERLNRNLTQAALADEAGLSLSTVKRLEAGASTQFVAVIRILRVLGLLDNLSGLLPEPSLSPIDALARRGGTRQRARGPRKPEQVDSKDGDWSWGDES